MRTCDLAAPPTGFCHRCMTSPAHTCAAKPACLAATASGRVSKGFTASSLDAGTDNRADKPFLKDEIEGQDRRHHYDRCRHREVPIDAVGTKEPGDTHRNRTRVVRLRDQQGPEILIPGFDA